MSNLRNIPERIAYLAVLFLTDKISKQEQKELEDWVSESDDNFQMFQTVIKTSTPTHYPWGYRIAAKGGTLATLPVLFEEFALLL